MPKVTAVLTSCNRPDLLFRTLNSFFKFNNYPLEQIIIVEDGASPLTFLSSYSFPIPSHIIATGQRVGQIAAIDYAYSLVDTDYIFHLEDDWEFYRSNFIQNSLRILEHEPDCLQVWLRASCDTMGHPLDKTIYRLGIKYINALTWQKLAYDYVGTWHGFSFNPGLRRLQDYIKCKGYGYHYIKQQCSFSDRTSGEEAISIYYKSIGKFAAILTDRAGSGYVRHIGDFRTVHNLLKT